MQASINSIATQVRHDYRHQDGRLTSRWYRKSTDTGVLLNFHSLGPDLYKRFLIAGMIHRIFMTTSNWTLFSDSLLEAHGILQNNQCPKHFIQRVTNFTLSNIVSGKNSVNKSKDETVKPNFSTMMAIEYGEKVSEEFRSNRNYRSSIIVFALFWNQ